jgi:hypothetical protein
MTFRDDAHNQALAMLQQAPPEPPSLVLAFTIEIGEDPLELQLDDEITFDQLRDVYLVAGWEGVEAAATELSNRLHIALLAFQQSQKTRPIGYSTGEVGGMSLSSELVFDRDAQFAWERWQNGQRIFNDACDVLLLTIRETLIHIERAANALAEIYFIRALGVVTTLWNDYKITTIDVTAYGEAGNEITAQSEMPRNVERMEGLRKVVQELVTLTYDIVQWEIRQRGLAQQKFPTSGAEGGPGSDKTPSKATIECLEQKINKIDVILTAKKQRFEKRLASARKTHPLALALFPKFRKTVDNGKLAREVVDTLRAIIQTAESFTRTNSVEKLFPEESFDTSVYRGKGLEAELASAVLKDSGEKDPLAYPPILLDLLEAPNFELDLLDQAVIAYYMRTFYRCIEEKNKLLKERKAEEKEFTKFSSGFSLISFVIPPLRVIAFALEAANALYSGYQAMASIRMRYREYAEEFDQAVMALGKNEYTSALYDLGEVMTTEPSVTEIVLRLLQEGVSLVGAASVIRSLPRGEMGYLDLLSDTYTLLSQ